MNLNLIDNVSEKRYEANIDG